VTVPELHLLEALAFGAWPAEQVERADGWRLRWMHGVSRRANSAWTNEATGDVPLADRIARAEAFYAARGSSASFQISPAAHPPELDDELAARGYRIEAPVSIQTARAETAHEGGAEGPRRVTTVIDHPYDVRVDSHCAEEWFEVSARKGRFATTPDVYRGLLDRIGPRALYAWARRGSEPVGACLGVVDGAWLGVFSMSTLPAHRRKGIGRALLSKLVSAGAARGASNVYLQVERDNHAALALYARAGFRHLYGYHYRVAR
jgi:ribosomal protein S18 acetylase RimI-like enzyme